MGPRATTGSGDIEGRTRGEVQLFASVPYAAPPTAERRFLAPAPHPGWRDVRSATRFGPAAPQLPSGGMTSRHEVHWNEDCLTLNIATPAVDEARRPVFFWIHGGAYQTGQGNIPWYSGSSFATRGDIVTVSINYRLGALGFADMSRFGPEYANSGANGLLDMVAALEWVRDNIAAFGGDPDRVTIGGESAGAFATCTLLTMPAADGLFHRAIAQSGAGHHTVTPDQAAAVGELLLTELGVSTLDEALAVEPRKILDAQVTVQAKIAVDQSLKDDLQLTTQPFYPVTGSVVPEAPHIAATKGAGRGVALMTGSNLHETTLFMLEQLDEAGVRRLVAEHSANVDEILDAYRSEGITEPHEMAVAISTDWSFRIPAVRMAEAREPTGAATWLYLFSWESRHRSLRSTHALEIPFTFNTLDAPGVDVFLGPGDVPYDLGELMHDSWIAFIRTGDPSTAATGPWPTYCHQGRQVMDFNHNTMLRSDPSGVTREAWANLR